MVQAAPSALGGPRRELSAVPDPILTRGRGEADPLRFEQTLAFDGWTVLLSRHDGSIRGGSEGLYDLDCRVLSRHVLRLDGGELECAGDPLTESDRWSGTLLVRRHDGSRAGPRLPQDAWEIRVERRVGPGMSERISVENHSMAPAAASLSLEVGADFADSLTRGGLGRIANLEPRWDTSLNWEPGGQTLTIRGTTRHDDRVDERGLRVAIQGPQPELERREEHRADERAGDVQLVALLSWPIDLQPGARWQIDLEFASLSKGSWRTPRDRPERPALRAAFSHSRTRLEPADSLVAGAFDRAADDLLSLRNWDLESSRDGSRWLPNAGVPWFTGLFGRDVLTAGWQAALLGPELVRGALDAVAEVQGRAFDPATDEEPGKLIHEMRRGPLAVLGLRPQARYYGSQTTSSMFVVALSELWHWTGDLDDLRRHRGTAARAIEWAERLGDADGDGFLEYDGHAPGGLKNQGWKDSDEAIRYPDGSIVENPIATVEEQAFHFLALQRLAEILVALDEQPDEVERLLARASRLREAWDRAYWMPEESFYALALDGNGRQVRSISSNPIHALGAGMVPADKARAVADRLLAEDLFSGWGIRTLSAEHPSYNPFAYHLGSLWPVENATAALGFKRYGLDDHLDRLVSAMFGAIAGCRELRAPEAFTGHPRRDRDHPLAYPGGCSPQAWSASAIVQLVQAMLGLYPFAPARTLALVRPRLPAWLPELTLRNLRVGDATVDLRFSREDDGSASHDVIERTGSLLVVAVPPPNDVEEPSLVDAVSRWGLEHAPGRLGRALKIGLGLDSGQAA